jgi:mRNA interferase RelE/StbE
VPARYRVEIAAKALRQLEALPKRIKERIDGRILALADDPRPHGVTKLQGQESCYRIRVGDYRVIYTISDAVLLVLVVEVVNRRDAYR